MNHAQIDHLLQVTAPRSEPLAGLSRSRDAGPPFDNVFRQASAAGTPQHSDAHASPPSSPSHFVESTSSSGDNSPAREDDSKTPLEEAVSDDAYLADEPIESTATENSDSRADEESADDSPSTEEAGAAGVAILASEQVTKRTAADKPILQVDATTHGEVEAVDSGATQPHDDAPAKTHGKKAENAESPPVAATVIDVESTNEPAEAGNEQGKPVVPNHPVPSKLGQPNGAAAALASEADATVNQATSEQPANSKGQPQRHADRVKSSAQQSNAEQATNESASKSVSATTAVATGKSSPAVERTEPAIESERKSTARADAATRDAATAPVDHAAPIARPVETTANVPTIANVPPQLAAEATGAASTAATVKTADGASEAKLGILSLSRVDRSSANGARGGHRPGQTESTPHVDPARFVSRVARAVQTAQERGGPLQLRLSPPELGAMRIELTVNQGTLTATIETDNSNAKQLLIDNLPALRDRLADQNIKIERFDVDVRRDPSGNQQNYAPQDRDQSRHQNSAGRNLGHERRQSAVPTLDDPQPVRRTISNTSINVVA